MRELLCGIRDSPAQCAQLTLAPDVVWDRDFGSGRAWWAYSKRSIGVGVLDPERETSMTVPSTGF